MAADIAREIIEQSKGGGGKLAFSLSIVTGVAATVFDQPPREKVLFLSISKDVNQTMIYHIHKPLAAGKAIVLTYANHQSAYDVIKSILREYHDASVIGVELVLYKNSNNIVEISPLTRSKRIEYVPAFLQEKLNLLDVIDVEEE